MSSFLLLSFLTYLNQSLFQQLFSRLPFFTIGHIVLENVRIVFHFVVPFLHPINQDECIVVIHGEVPELHTQLVSKLKDNAVEEQMLIQLITELMISVKLFLKKLSHGQTLNLLVKTWDSHGSDFSMPAFLLIPVRFHSSTNTFVSFYYGDLGYIKTSSKYVVS